MPQYVHGNVGIEDLNSILEQLENGSDRDLAILGGTLLENSLRRHIEFNIETNTIFSGEGLWHFTGPLGTFSSKIEAARAFGVISDVEYNHLKIFKKIRNHCAHSLGIAADDRVSFDHNPIRQWLLDLYSPQMLDLADEESAEAIRLSHRQGIDNEPRLIFKTLMYHFTLKWMTGGNPMPEFKPGEATGDNAPS